MLYSESPETGSALLSIPWREQYLCPKAAAYPSMHELAA